jgi:transcriptional regulator with XRE-family HTH domain
MYKIVFMKNIHILQEVYGFTDENMAEYLGLKPCQYALLENDVMPLTNEILDKLSYLVGYSLHDLCAEDFSAKEFSLPHKNNWAVSEMQAWADVNQATLTAEE